MLKPTRSQRKQFVLKDIPRAIHSNFDDLIRPHLVESRYLRLPCDRIPDQHIFVYEFLTESLLSFSRRSVPVNTRMQILQAALRGIAELHHRDIVHLGQYVSRRCCLANDHTRRETGQHYDRLPPRRPRYQNRSRSGHRHRERCISPARQMHQRDAAR